MISLCGSSEFVIPQPILGAAPKKRKLKKCTSKGTGHAKPGRPKLRQDRAKARRGWNYQKTKMANLSAPRRAVCPQCNQHRSEFVCQWCGYSIFHHPVFTFAGMATCNEPDCLCQRQPVDKSKVCCMFSASHNTPDGMRQPVCMPCYSSHAVAPTNQDCSCRLPNTERSGYDLSNMVPRLLEGIHDMIATICCFDTLPLYVKHATEAEMVEMITSNMHGGRPVLFSTDSDGDLVLAIDKTFVASKMHSNIMVCLRMVNELLVAQQASPAQALPPLPPSLPALPEAYPEEEAQELDALPPPVRVAV